MDYRLTTDTPRQAFIAGLRDTIPLIVGAIPFGIVFGALGASNGLSPEATLGMSLFVFAGSAQAIAAGLVKAGADVTIIILTTLVVNLRHALYSATLAPYLKGLGQKWLLPLGFWLTDETFVITARYYQEHPDSPHKHWYQFASSLAMYLNWNLSTLFGVVIGAVIPDMRQWGAVAMVVTFIGMVVPLMQTRPMLLAALAAGIAAIALRGLPNNLWLIAAALIGVAVGVLAESRAARR
jgi:4-azaleucine resistance transporter AzlC